MSTSDKALLRQLLGHGIAAAFLALFGGVYELFSHQVYSYWMLYAFAFPLCLGVLPYGILLLKGKRPGPVFRNLWNAAVAAMSVGSVMRGVLEIYGTTNRLWIVYPLAAGILAGAALLSLPLERQTRRHGRQPPPGSPTRQTRLP